MGNITELLARSLSRASAPPEATSQAEAWAQKGLDTVLAARRASPIRHAVCEEALAVLLYNVAMVREVGGFLLFFALHFSFRFCFLFRFDVFGNVNLTFFFPYSSPHHHHSSPATNRARARSSPRTSSRRARSTCRRASSTRRTRSAGWTGAPARRVCSRLWWIGLRALGAARQKVRVRITAFEPN